MERVRFVLLNVRPVTALGVHHAQLAPHYRVVFVSVTLPALPVLVLPPTVSNAP